MDPSLIRLLVDFTIWALVVAGVARMVDYLFSDMGPW